MAMAMKEQAAIIAVAFFNGIFVYPYIKRAYRHFYTVQANPTHYVLAQFPYNIIGIP